MSSPNESLTEKNIIKERIQWNTTDYKLPTAIIKQLALKQKYKYLYKKQSNGDIYNNTILYVKTGIAHAHQVHEAFEKVISKLGVECEININLVQRYTGEYIGYAFVYVSNPAVYYALLGKNIDGTERIEYIDDPEWVKTKNNSLELITSWADMADEDQCPKIKNSLDPLATLDNYDYDEQQQKHEESSSETYGTFECSPAFIKENDFEPLENCKLYVSVLPNDNKENLDYLYDLFAPYAATTSEKENKKIHFPRIEIRNTETSCYAIVTYSNPYDAAFALLMLQKMRIKYNGVVKILSTRYAFNKR